MYYDIDDILCEDQQVEVLIGRTIYKGAHFKEESHDSDEPALPGDTMHVPFWLARRMLQISKDQPEANKINVPEMFSEQFMDSLISSPTQPNLRDQSNYYYEMAMKIIDNLPEKVEEDLFKGTTKLSIIMKATIIERAKHIIKMSRLSYIEKSATLLNSLTLHETRLFNMGREISESYARWKEESINKRSRPFMQKRIKH